MPFFEPVWYNRVLVNWPRAHCGVLQLTEASYLGPDSPRTSPRNETVKQCRRQMTVANYPVQLFIFGIFEHKWGTRKHIDDLKKYSWCIPVQKEIKPIIWGAAITPEPRNRQQCWFIFEDPNVRVARLLESLATINQCYHTTSAAVVNEGYGPGMVHKHEYTCFNQHRWCEGTLIARFMGPTWDPSGADRTRVGPMLAPWTLLSG